MIYRAGNMHYGRFVSATCSSVRAHYKRSKTMVDYLDFDVCEFDYATAMRPYYLGEEILK